jgi:hypothetical protein
VIGLVFGMLTVLRREDVSSRSGVKWRCSCSCGSETVATSNKLRTGATQSCGCYRRTHRVTHGQARRRKTPEYATWHAMLRRCSVPSLPAYPRYGGRGIRVCDRWQSFESFFADMGPRPSAAHSIDRIDNDGHYEPGNVRWALPSVQNRNKSTNRMLTWKDETMTVTDWAERCGMDPNTLGTRLRRGWSLDRALTGKVQAKQARAEVSP